MIYFEPHFNFIIVEPQILRFAHVVYFDNGVLTKIDGKKIKQHLPWFYWGAHLQYDFWLKRAVKSLFKGNVQVFLNKTKKLVVVVNPFSDNYFHWITEVIPKLLYIQKSLTNYKVLLPANNKREFQMQTLKLLDIPYDFIKKETAFLAEVFISTHYSHSAGYYLNHNVLQIQQLFYAIQPLSTGVSKKIYVSRKQASRRNIVNESALIVILEKYGFDVVYPENLSFFESIALYKTVNTLVSIHGAALTNMIFLPEGSTVFELKLEKVKNDKCYFLLANAARLNYYYQNCKSADDSTDHINASIYVGLAEFEQNLQRIVGN